MKVTREVMKRKGGEREEGKGEVEEEVGGEEGGRRWSVD